MERRKPVFGFIFSDFEFVWDLVLRISNFVFS